ncbi:hypothetical protein HYDPIDRAFT_135569 [Hydnomerulius pinastri MD-312]|uniref:Uncharacterized protein n=1 Tax=Hydnomerulius pinastri MD-312 TaxID=994086 RepID=A0A0C9W6J2_9AGAM|nr:hypothetical protein HYDPIDRAFT_135569 [Hydnomerulius pinastri MD-312]
MEEAVVHSHHKYAQHFKDDSHNPYAPFRSHMDWSFARWAKMRGPGSTAVSELLSIDGLAAALGLSYTNSRELNKIIDENLPSSRPRFQREQIIVAGEAFDVYFRNIIECIKALFGDPEFTPYLLLQPERHYVDDTKKERVYFDMNTGKWWWATQKQVEATTPGATIVPVIIASDKTQLTLFRNKSAYPVYMTIGNLPKDIRRKPSRRGQILLAYLPATRLEHMTNKAARRRTLANLFHACMGRVLAPLKTAGVEGLPMASGDGLVRRNHPILAAYIGDYPEQLLVCCCKAGECPKCEVLRDDVGKDASEHPLRDLDTILAALDALDDGILAFTRACQAAGIKPVVEPFWKGLPFVDIYLAITPDILHQLYQGLVKHLVSWIKSVYGPAEIDARCRRLPPNHNVRVFINGISTLYKVTGKEHADICRILLGLVIGIPLRNGFQSQRLIRSVRALLDFLYLAQYPTHTSSTLKLLEDALQRFHENKNIFVDLGVRTHFKLPKLHSLSHYTQSIKLYGTTDNYDTQYTERLHIDFAKDAYSATNCKDEFPQMTQWLERKEKIQHHDAFIKWTIAGCPPSLHHPPPSLTTTNSTSSHLQMTKAPSVKAVTFEKLETSYGATYFRDALARYIVSRRNPSFTDTQVERESAKIYFRFSTIPVFHKMKFLIQGPSTLMDIQSVDAAHIKPASKDRRGRTIPGRFDTVLVHDGESSFIGSCGYRVAQLRAVFQLPERALGALFPSATDLPPHHLAYVEWFTPFVQQDPNSLLYRVSRSTRNGKRLASVIDAHTIRRSCHLYPDFGPVAPRDWGSNDVLDKAAFFWVNPFTDRHAYMTVN